MRPIEKRPINFVSDCFDSSSVPGKNVKLLLEKLPLEQSKFDGEGFILWNI